MKPSGWRASAQRSSAPGATGSPVEHRTPAPGPATIQSSLVWAFDPRARTSGRRRPWRRRESRSWRWAPRNPRPGPGRPPGAPPRRPPAPRHLLPWAPRGPRARASWSRPPPPRSRPGRGSPAGERRHSPVRGDRDSLLEEQPFAEDEYLVLGRGDAVDPVGGVSHAPVIEQEGRVDGVVQRALREARDGPPSRAATPRPPRPSGPGGSRRGRWLRCSWRTRGRPGH